MAKITEKSTKAEIMEEYQRVLEELKQKKESIVNPVEVVRESKKAETIEKVEAVKVEKLVDIVEKLNQEITKANEEVARYNDIKAAISIKEQELKDLFEIERNAFSSIALEIAQKESREKFELEMKAKRELAELQIKAEKESAKKYEDEILKNIDISKQNFKESQKREKEQWEYDFKREKTIAENELNDILQAKEKGFKDRIVEKENELSAREEKIADAENQIAILQAKLEQIEKQTTEKVTEKLKTANGFETRYLKKEYESSVALLENKIETLTSQLQKLEEANKISGIKLDQAYSKLENLANRSVESASNSKYMSSLEGIAKNNQTK
jgi:hypothetical protein